MLEISLVGKTHEGALGIVTSFIDDNTLSVNVARLRKKLEAVGLKDFIETKKGVGYGLRHDG